MSGRSSALLFALRYAARSLWRSGQRGLLAVVCVAFGVLSLVGLQLVAAYVDDALLADPVEQLSGDLRLARDGRPLDAADAAALDRLRDAGALTAWTPTAQVAAGFLRAEGNGRVYLVGRVLGVEPEVYPLAGPLRLRDGTPLDEALASPGHAVVSRDLAHTLDLAPGDRVTLAGLTGTGAAGFVVGAVADQLPDRQGNTVLLSLGGARRVAGTDAVAQHALVLTAQAEALAARLEADGWTVARPAPRNDEIARVFGFMLPAAGLLGLLLGGIGVANTMQVVLSRRIPEVAALKTLGYRQRDLLALFGLEAALLGGLGGGLGVLGGVAVAAWLRTVLMGALPFLLDVRLYPGVLAGGLLAGVGSAVLFGLVAIVRTSAVRPAVLLRQIPVRPRGRTRLALAGLYAVLFVLFGLLSAALMGSLVEGFGVLAAGLAGLALFGGLLVLALLLVVRLPLPGFPLLRMARRNLGRRPVRSAAALVAVFAGVFVIGLSAMVMAHARDEVDGQRVAFGAHNLVVYGTPEHRDRLAEAGPGVPVYTSLTAEVLVRQTDGTPVPALAQVEGREARADWNLTVAEGRWPETPGEALMPDGLEIGIGDTLVVARAGREAAFALVGRYVPKEGGFLTRPRGLVVPEAAALRLGGDATSALYTLAVPPHALSTTADRLGAALPDAFVLTAPDVSDFLVGAYRGLFLLVVAVAGLAFVAGAVLIANAVGLALIERRRELGVLKAVGYSAGQTLRTVLFENALLGAVAAAVGLLAIRVVLLGLDRAADVEVPFDPVLGLAMAALAVALAVGSAALAAWTPVRVRPLEVLRAE